MSDELRQCVLCPNKVEPDRWMLCSTCQTRVEARNQAEWGGEQ